MRIVFFDIDGTLAIGTKVPDSARKAIDKLRSQNDLVFICTGRSLAYAKKNFSEYCDGFITSNGRYGIYKDDVIVDEPLTNKQLEHITSVLKDYQCDYMLLGQQHGYLFGSDEVYNDLLKGYHPGFVKREYNNEQIYSFDIFFDDDNHFNKIDKELSEVIFNRHGPVNSADSTIIGYDKGTAIRTIIDYFNIKDENTYAFGDGTNDLLMFKAVTNKVAMGNAIEQLKQEATYVTKDINDDGVYYALKHFNLID